MPDRPVETTQKPEEAPLGTPTTPTTVEFTLEPPQPFRLDLTALALVRRPNNLIDKWEDGRYRRVVPVSEPSGPTPVTQVLLEIGDAAGPTSAERPFTDLLTVRATGHLPPAELEAAARRSAIWLFGLDVDLTGFYELAANDEHLAPLVRRLRGLHPPRYPTLFQALLNAIPCQQVTLRLGMMLLERLARRYGPEFPFAPSDSEVGPLPLPSAATLAAAELDELGGMGFSRTKARSLTGLATEAITGRLPLAELATLPDEVVAERLQGLFGIGRWTSDYVLLRGLGRLDVFPYGDSGARNGLAKFLGEEGKPSYDWVAERVAPWAPYAGFVYLHLLIAGLLGRGDFEAPQLA